MSSSTCSSPSTSASRRGVKRTSGSRSSSASTTAPNGSSSSSTSASKASPPHDPYYGHEETATTAARFIISLFACPEYAPSSSNTSRRPSLVQFIAYALHRTRLPPLVTTASLLLLSRLKARFPSAKGSSGHRLFLSSFMTASKSLCDDTYSNASWTIVGQDLFSISEVNRMEREYMSYLEWNCVTHLEELLALERHLHHNFSTPACCPPHPSYPSTSYASTSSTTCAASSSSHPHPASTSSSSSTPTDEYDAYPSPPCSPVALSSASSSNNSSPSAPSTPPSMYSLPPSISAPTGTKSHQHHHSSNPEDSIVSRSW